MSHGGYLRDRCVFDVIEMGLLSMPSTASLFKMRKGLSRILALALFFACASGNSIGIGRIGWPGKIAYHVLKVALMSHLLQNQVVIVGSGVRLISAPKGDFRPSSGHVITPCRVLRSGSFLNPGRSNMCRVFARTPSR